jgi:hypothetical protein
MLTRRLVVLVVAAALAGCGRTEDDAPPVGALSVAVARQSAPVGSPLDLTYRFTVAPGAPPFAEDYTVFVHMVGLNGEQLWTDDHRPPTPTRRWSPGATVEYTRTMFVPRISYAGAIDVIAGLYSPATGDRLRLAGEDAGMRSYRVAGFEVRERDRSDGIEVVFGNGWHDTEVSGVEEWHWMRQEGRLSFDNPKEDATLLLQLDQPANAFPDGQRIDIRLDPAARGPDESSTERQLIDSFTLRFGEPQLRRIPLTAEQLGSGDAVTLVLAVDRTFVPATMPNAQSTDPRELGVRVFQVYVEPKRVGDPPGRP